MHVPHFEHNLNIKVAAKILFTMRRPSDVPIDLMTAPPSALDVNVNFAAVCQAAAST